jgi:hypothetical protein
VIRDDQVHRRWVEAADFRHATCGPPPRVGDALCGLSPRWLCRNRGCTRRNAGTVTGHGAALKAFLSDLNICSTNCRSSDHSLLFMKRHEM